MAKLRVSGYDGLVKDTFSNAVVNTSHSEYTIYMARYKARNKQGDDLRTACKEINNLKAELREIKDLLKEVVKK
jgi:hypothetical protein|tara:strand:- start:987 stop:1208 length:222 start_codon:yes stop_codon:yes gene_type:complete